MAGSWTTDRTTMPLMTVGLFTIVSIQLIHLISTRKTNEKKKRFHFLGKSPRRQIRAVLYVCGTRRDGEKRKDLSACVCLWSGVCSMFISRTQKRGGKKECVVCAAMQLTPNRNPRTMWNVSSNCQWLRPTLVEQLQYTVSGRVLSLWIKIKCGPLHRYSQREGEKDSGKEKSSLQAHRCGVGLRLKIVFITFDQMIIFNINQLMVWCINRKKHFFGKF